MPTPSPQKRRYLICYSPRDHEGKAEITAHLAAARGSVSVWSADQVPPGSPVSAAFQEAAAGCDAALLLLSADFFASLDEPQFVGQVEELRRQHEERGLELIPVLWRHCDWRAESWLTKLKPLPVDGFALTALDRAQRDLAFADIARRLSGRARLSMRGILGGMGREVGIEMPSRATLIAKSRNLLAMNEAAFERAVDLSLGIHQVPQLVRAQHVAHGGARGPEEARPLEEDLLGYLLRVERLLIVGQPGAGKTQTLRTLCGQLLEVAREESSLPIPFLINLSTFSNYQGTLRAWLSEGLKECAAIPVAIGQVLLQQGQLFLLLDGLDEMAAARRGSALAELNALMSAADPALARCVICSRTLEYGRAGIELVLPAALELQPLRSVDVLEAIEQAGAPAAPLCAAMVHDLALAALMQTPLLLTIAIRAFTGIPNLVLAGHTTGKLHQMLFDMYVVQMLRRNTADRSQTATQTLGWLRWLAQYLMRGRSSLFLIEELLPCDRSMVGAYKIAFWLFRPLLNGLSVGLLGGLVFDSNIGISIGLGALLIEMANFPSVVGPQIGWIGGLFISHGVRQSTALLFDKLGARSQQPCGWKFFMKITNYSGEIMNSGFAGWLLSFVMLLVFALLAIALFRRFLLFFICVEKVGRPNGLTHFSLCSGLVEMFSTGVVYGMGVGLLSTPGIGFLFGWIWGLDSGLDRSGPVLLDGPLRHYILRLVLWREGKLPLRLVPWLESCRSNLLLRRQGGAYMFWHKTLQDYFAELDDARLADLAKRIEAKPEYVQTY